MLTELHIGAQGLSDRFVAGVYRSLASMCKTLNLAPRDLFMGRPRPEAAACEIVVVLNKKQSFHPLILALRTNGYNVRATNQFSAELHKDARVVIWVSEKGPPLDIMLYEEEQAQKQENSGILKIFVLDTIGAGQEQQHGDVLFLDRHRLDIRYLLHAIDRFSGQVITPERAPVETEKEEPSSGSGG
jgi:hypothetical protein